MDFFLINTRNLNITNSRRSIFFYLKYYLKRVFFYLLPKKFWDFLKLKICYWFALFCSSLLELYLIIYSLSIFIPIALAPSPLSVNMPVSLCTKNKNDLWNSISIHFFHSNHAFFFFFSERIDLKHIFSTSLPIHFSTPCLLQVKQKTILSGIITLTFLFFSMCYICIFVLFTIFVLECFPWLHKHTLFWFSSNLSDYSNPVLEVSSASFSSFGHP